MSEILFVSKQLGLETNQVINSFENSMSLEDIRKSVMEAKDRLFISWSSVDMKDSEGERIDIPDLVRAHETLLKRGGAVTDMHTNKVVGKTLAYKVLLNEKHKKLGVMQLIKIYDDMPADHSVWNNITTGKYKGLSVGGQYISPIYEEESDGSMIKTLDGFMQYETAAVDDPANPGALVEAYSLVAKSKNNITKAFAGYKNFAECVSKNSDKEDPEAYCATIQRQVEEVDNSKKYLNNKDNNLEHKKKSETDSESIENQTNNGGNPKMSDNSIKKEDQKPKEDEMDNLREENKQLKQTVKELTDKLKSYGKDEEEDQKPKEEDKKKNEEPAGQEAADSESSEDSDSEEDSEDPKKQLKKVNKELADIRKQLNANSKVARKSTAPTPDAGEGVKKTDAKDIKKRVEESEGYLIATGQVKKSWSELHKDQKNSLQTKVDSVLKQLEGVQ